jgi:hypothetical protein
VKIEDITEYFQTNLYEMSTFFDTDTGLSPGTKLWVRVEPEGLPHIRYRIKISHPQKGSAVFGIWGDDAQQLAGDWNISGRELKKIRELIRLVHDSFIKHIDGEISSMALGNALLKAKPIIEKI